MEPKDIHHSEYEDFRDMLESVGRRPDQFEIEGTSPTILAEPGNVGVVVNSVIVTSRSTRKSRPYERGSLEPTSNGRPAWVNAVVQDISNGEFD